MSRYTIVYVDDEMNPQCFGTFRDRLAANARMKLMDRELDEDRDIAGGSAGLLAVCAIHPLRTWLVG